MIIAIAICLLIIAYLMAISARDLVRLLISLELMFSAVFLAIIPLFSISAQMAFAVLVITIFTSSAELLVLITAIVITDRLRKGVEIEKASVGGDTV
ncbi:MAG: F420H(2):quinone oxidoreductase [Archaeoglobi archaeon]|nr:F420H(2):quinone oxidoreductase [Archaeoglobus sp.]TDA28279.1 MAG: F420H(2):quinone oxidoreductase [Archaeoglobi archaeon]TDA29054.1 MAG: F420H(2):quinone oxidoreductase [Archaeoglobi archaeon]